MVEPEFGILGLWVEGCELKGIAFELKLWVGCCGLDVVGCGLCGLAFELVL